MNSSVLFPHTRFETWIYQWHALCLMLSMVCMVFSRHGSKYSCQQEACRWVIKNMYEKK